MSNKIKVGDKVTIKFDVLDSIGLDCVRDCAKGKVYEVTKIGNPSGHGPDDVVFIDDVGDGVCVYQEHVSLI